jgi:hypothetical protein
MDKTPTKGEYLEVLLRSPKTIFSTTDAALLWNENDNTVVTDRLKKYVKAGKLVRPYRGLYAKDKIMIALNWQHVSILLPISVLKLS